MKLRFLAPAEVEMLDAARKYDAVAPGLGDRFIDEVESRAILIDEQPQIGTPQGEFRRVLLRKFPFSIIYAVESEEITIIAVAHQRQRPGYWEGR